MRTTAGQSSEIRSVSLTLDGKRLTTYTGSAIQADSGISEGSICNHMPVSQSSFRNRTGARLQYPTEPYHMPKRFKTFIKHGINQQECEVEPLLQIVACADSTATALRTTFLFILTNPSAYRNLQHEISTAVNANKISSPVVQNAEAERLPYLQACIQEGLRMFMPLHSLAGRVSPSPDEETVNGIHLPSGTEVGIATYAANHRCDIYGPDADTFRPERWIQEDSDSLRRYERINELVFGAGRSRCLGKGIAWSEMEKITFAVSVVTRRTGRRG